MGDLGAQPPVMGNDEHVKGKGSNDQGVRPPHRGWTVGPMLGTGEELHLGIASE